MTQAHVTCTWPFCQLSLTLKVLCEFPYVLLPETLHAFRELSLLNRICLINENQEMADFHLTQLRRPLRDHAASTNKTAN